MATVADLEFGSYLLLTTHRKDGTPVPTPVWAVRDGVDILVWTVQDSGKVKRLRARSKVTIADCDVRGKVKGETVAGRGRLLDADGTEHTRDLLRKKYGIMGRLTLWGSLVRRGRDGTVAVRISAA
jgi:uncharacterized protein